MEKLSLENKDKLVTLEDKLIKSEFSRLMKDKLNSQLENPSVRDKFIVILRRVMNTK